MNNQLVKREDVSIFDKIRAFFKGLFTKNNRVEEINQPQKNNIVKENIYEIKEKERKSEFIKVIEKHPDRVDNLSDDVLDRLIKYYRKITSSKKARIKELRGN